MSGEARCVGCGKTWEENHAFGGECRWFRTSYVPFEHERRRGVSEWVYNVCSVCGPESGHPVQEQCVSTLRQRLAEAEARADAAERVAEERRERAKAAEARAERIVDVLRDVADDCLGLQPADADPIDLLHALSKECNDQRIAKLNTEARAEELVTWGNRQSDAAGRAEALAEVREQQANELRKLLRESEEYAHAQLERAERAEARADDYESALQAEKEHTAFLTMELDELRVMAERAELILTHYERSLIDATEGRDAARERAERAERERDEEREWTAYYREQSAAQYKRAEWHMKIANDAMRVGLDCIERWSHMWMDEAADEILRRCEAERIANDAMRVGLGEVGMSRILEEDARQGSRGALEALWKTQWRADAWKRLAKRYRETDKRAWCPSCGDQFDVCGRCIDSTDYVTSVIAAARGAK